jgi:ADP-ribose pyrophosphatase YjhB (NUDIX family)
MNGGNFIGVGGLVYFQEQYLLVKQAFGEYRDLWILPGGHVKPGEALHRAVEREVREESGVKAEAQGVIAVRSRIREPEITDCYVVFLMEYREGQPAPDGKEVLAAAFCDYNEISRCESIVNLSRIIIEKHHQGGLTLLSRSWEFDFYNINALDYQLFV